MFNDRDLAVLGIGALLAVLCLLLPLPFAGKAVAGVIVLLAGLTLAFLRLGPDRVTLETWLWRRLRYARRARQYTYQQPGWRLPRSRRQTPAVAPELTVTSLPDSVHPDLPQPVALSWRPLIFLPDMVPVYPLISVCLAVVGAYFVAWLAQDGGAELARLFR